MGSGLPLQVFVASPGDTAAEREAVIKAINAFGSTASNRNSIGFEAVSSERVRGTARRTQEAINELISECHYMVVMFKCSWGSTPGSPWGFTSGTEEEFFMALLALGLDSQPLRDIWLVFLQCDNRASQIDDLEHRIVAANAPYFETLTDVDELVSKLTETLTDWAMSNTNKQARHIDLLPSSGKDILRVQRLTIKGEQQFGNGLPEDGLRTLADAANAGGPSEKLIYAKYLGRRARLDEAVQESEAALRMLLSSPTPASNRELAEVRIAQAGFERRNGKAQPAIDLLFQANEQLSSDDPYECLLKARALDERGWAYQAMEKSELALADFSESLELRKRVGNTDEIAQSQINLARSDLKLFQQGQGADLHAARQLAEQAHDQLSKGAPTATLANARALLAEINLALDDPADALKHARNCVSLNQQLGNNYGEAIGHYLWAKSEIALGQPADALEEIEQCIALNQAMGEERGLNLALELRDSLNGDNDSPTEV